MARLNHNPALTPGLVKTSTVALELSYVPALVPGLHNTPALVPRLDNTSTLAAKLTYALALVLGLA